MPDNQTPAASQIDAFLAKAHLNRTEAMMIVVFIVGFVIGAIIA